MIKIELEVKRIDVVYNRRRYQIESRWASDGSGMFIYSARRLIYSSWNQEVNTPEGIEVEDAYREYKNLERKKLTDPALWS